jgi:hypothetical protein
MPCRSYEDENQSGYLEELRKHNDRLARIACRLAEAVENGETIDALQHKHDKPTREALAWYKQHKIDDAKAKEAERKEAERKEQERVKTALRQHVIDRMTPEEREAFGIKK